MGEETRKLRLFGAVNLMLLALLGTGLFFGQALSAQHAGPAAIIAWIVLGLNTIYVGLLFGELASRYPQAGGIYLYAKKAYGMFPSFLIGWAMWLVATINTSILIVGALQYAFPTMSTPLMLTISLGLVIALHIVAYIGMGASEFVLNALAAALLAFVLITILVGAGHVNDANYSPFFISPPFMLFIALFFILETYFGWETATFLAEETHEPEKTIPKAILISTVIAVVLGTALTAVLFGIIPADQLATRSAPLADIFEILFGGVGGTILRAGVFISFIGSAAGNIVSGPRLLQSMAKDKMFIAQLATISPLTNTPSKAIAFQAVFSSLVVLAALGNYTYLLSIMVPLALLMYIPTLLSVPILRKKDDTPIPFKAPFGRVGAVISSLLFITALIVWAIIDPRSLQILGFILGLLFFGMAIYLLMNIYYNPSTQLFFSDALSYPARLLENFIVPKSIRKKMLTLFAGLEGKKVLEIGAGVGSFTHHLSEAVTKAGSVYAVEAGKNNIIHLQERFGPDSNVQVIYDEHITSRVHPSIDRVDAVFSIGMLGYIQEDHTLLQHIADILPEHAPVCFMEYIDYFGLIPNPAWLSDYKELKNRFIEAGLAVRVEKVPGTFWNYILVYGVKSKHSRAYA